MAFPTALFTKISAKLIPGHGTNAVEGLGLASAVNELQDEMAGVQVVINFQNSGVPKSGTEHHRCPRRPPCWRSRLDANCRLQHVCVHGLGCTNLW